MTLVQTQDKLLEKDEIIRYCIIFAIILSGFATYNFLRSRLRNMLYTNLPESHKK